MSGPGGSCLVKGNVGIVIGEALVESGSEGRSSVVGVLLGSRGGLLGNSLDHHGDSNVVVVGGVLLLVSSFLRMELKVS